MGGAADGLAVHQHVDGEGRRLPAVASLRVGEGLHVALELSELVHASRGLGRGGHGGGGGLGAIGCSARTSHRGELVLCAHLGRKRRALEPLQARGQERVGDLAQQLDHEVADGVEHALDGPAHAPEEVHHRLQEAHDAVGDAAEEVREPTTDAHEELADGPKEADHGVDGRRDGVGQGLGEPEVDLGRGLADPGAGVDEGVLDRGDHLDQPAQRQGDHRDDGAEDLAQELAQGAPGAGGLVGRRGGVAGGPSQGVPRLLEVAQRLAHHLEGRADVLHHRAEAGDDAAGDANEHGDELGQPLDHRGDGRAGDLTEAAELRRRQRCGAAGHAGEDAGDLLTELGEGIGQVLEDRTRLLDGAGEAVLEALPDLLDAMDDLVERDEEALEPLVLGAVQLLAHRTGEAALLEELGQAPPEQLHPVPHAAGEVGDAAHVAAEGHHEAGHHRAEHGDDQDRRQQGGHDAADADAEGLERHREQGDHSHRRDHRADEHEEAPNGDDQTGEDPLDGCGDRLEGPQDGVEHVDQQAHDRLEDLGEGLTEHHGEGLQRALEQGLLPLEGVEELLAKASGGSLGPRHLVPQGLDGLGASQGHLPAVAHGGEAGVHDRVEGEQTSCAEGLHHAAVALGIAQVAGRRGELAHDVDHGAHLTAGLVEDLDAGAEDGLLRSAVRAHAASGLQERRGRARGVDVAVAQQAHGDQHIVEALVEHSARGGGLGQTRLEIAGLEVGELGDAQQPIGHPGCLVGGHAVGVERADDRFRSRGHAELPEGAGGEIEHGDQSPGRLRGGLPGGGQGGKPLDRLGGRELGLDASVDGCLAQHAKLAGGRPGHGADGSQPLLEAARSVGQG